MTKESPTDPIANAVRPDSPSESVQSLKQAMRTARFDDAERQGVQADLRASQIARLEMLQEALTPLLAQIPSDAADMFDVGLMPGATPRLFIDMIGFVEMARDSRAYRLVQDARHVRLTIAESSAVPTMVDAITQYVARRLLEREKALAADRPNAGQKAVTAEEIPSSVPCEEQPPREEQPPKRRHPFRWVGTMLSFVIDLLGAITFFAILAATGWYVWNRLHGRF